MSAQLQERLEREARERESARLRESVEIYNALTDRMGRLSAEIDALRDRLPVDVTMHVPVFEKRVPPRSQGV
jgi:hypothetical protein